ncbi:MAG: cyclic nucleotide-binding domain-containing protein [Nitrospinae bacterium]|nr:cyclic nucleotide-binding domain-containing protein [Nitrospinota bacterium]
MQKEDLIDLIQKVGFFKDMPADQSRKIIEMGKIKRYGKGDIVLKEGEISSKIYFLLKGGFMVSSEGNVLFYETRYGEFFGEIAAIDSQPRSAFVRANQENSYFFILDINDIFNKESPLSDGEKFYLKICRTFAERLRANDQKITNLSKEINKRKKAPEKFTFEGGL